MVIRAKIHHSLFYAEEATHLSVKIHLEGCTQGKSAEFGTLELLIQTPDMDQNERGSPKKRRKTQGRIPPFLAFAQVVRGPYSRGKFTPMIKLLEEGNEEVPLGSCMVPPVFMGLGCLAGVNLTPAEQEYLTNILQVIFREVTHRQNKVDSNPQLALNEFNTLAGSHLKQKRGEMYDWIRKILGPVMRVFSPGNRNLTAYLSEIPQGATTFSSVLQTLLSTPPRVQNLSKFPEENHKGYQQDEEQTPSADDEHEVPKEPIHYAD